MKRTNNYPDDEPAIKILLDQGLSRRRAFEIFGKPDPRKVADRVKYRTKHKPKPTIEKWRCAGCGWQVEVDDCLLCSSRRAKTKARVIA